MLYWWVMISYDCHGVPVCSALSYLDADNTGALRPPPSKRVLAVAMGRVEPVRL